jgi:uncharacterized protein YndB with AHSA1/START domain
MIDGNLLVTAKGDREIDMKRVFNAPRRLVFEAITKPKLVQRWLLGPDGWTMPVCEIDLRVGGRYRYVWRKAAQGKEMGVSGVFREVTPPERIVHTERFDEAWYPGEAVITTVLVEHGGKTTLTMTIQCASTEARDGMLKSGMETGVERSYQRMDEILATMA